MRKQSGQSSCSIANGKEDEDKQSRLLRMDVVFATRDISRRERHHLILVLTLFFLLFFLLLPLVLIEAYSLIHYPVRGSYLIRN